MRQTITQLACAIITLLFFSVSSFAQNRLIQVKIFPPKDNNERSHLIGILEIDHFVNTQDGAIVSEIGERELEVLKNTGYKYKIIIPDVAKRLDSINQIYYKAIQQNPAARVAFEQTGSVIDAIIKRPAAFEVKATYGGYYSFAEMNTAMDNLVAAYPSIASKTSLGNTSGGRAIWMIKISDNVATDEANEPELLFMGLQHAREAIGGASMIYLMQYLCEQYGVDPRITQLVNNREFYIIPCFNPDGWEYNRTNGGAGSGWRKNRRLISGTTYGVDLNRNWGVDWGNCSAPIQGSATSCGSPTASAETYYGPSAFSELETQAVRNFTKSRHITIGFDQHAFGPYYSLPFGRQILHTMPQKGQDYFTAVPALMGKYNAMRAADSYDALGYEVAGGFKDWMLMGELGTSIGSGLKDTVWAMTGEGGAGDGSGGSFGSFWAPAGQIVNLCKGMTYQNLQLAYSAGTYVDVQDSNRIDLTGFEKKLAFTVKRLGLGNTPVTVTLVPLENMKNIGAPKVINSMIYYGAVTDSIAFEYVAGMTAGQRIRYAWKIDAGGISFSDTITRYLKPTVLFSDDMEGAFATNWTNRASGTVASGFGYNYTGANWSFTTGGFNSTGALSESPNGTRYSSQTLRIVECNTILNLGNATSAHLTFWVKHKTENHRDLLQVQVSDNAGASWTTISGKTTVKEPGTIDDATVNGQPSLTGIQDFWIQEVFDLSAYLTKTDVRFRFRFTSDNDLSTFTMDTDEGFFIDNVMAIKTIGPLVTLPVNFIDFYGKLQNDQTVKLNWEAETDADHHHFEVERSANGVNFSVIGHGPNTEPYQFIDAQPYRGKNYYRIKQVDQDGTITYSKTIIINVGSKGSYTVYPNPVSDKLVVKLSGHQAETVKIELADAQGKLIYSAMVSQTTNAQDHVIDLGKFQPQVFMLKVVNSAGEVLYSDKVIKL